MPGSRFAMGAAGARRRRRPPVPGLADGTSTGPGGHRGPRAAPSLTSRVHASASRVTSTTACSRARWKPTAVRARGATLGLSTGVAMAKKARTARRKTMPDPAITTRLSDNPVPELPLHDLAGFAHRWVDAGGTRLHAVEGGRSNGGPTVGAGTRSPVVLAGRPRRRCLGRLLPRPEVREPTARRRTGRRGGPGHHTPPCRPSIPNGRGRPGTSRSTSCPACPRHCSPAANTSTSAGS